MSHRFIEESYGLEMNRQTLTNISRAIATGSEKGKFVLPKGTSGKVKLAAKAKASDSKEVRTARSILSKLILL